MSEPVICPLDQEACDDEGDRERCRELCAGVIDQIAARLDEEA